SLLILATDTITILHTQSPIKTQQSDTKRVERLTDALCSTAEHSNTTTCFSQGKTRKNVIPHTPTKRHGGQEAIKNSRKRQILLTTDEHRLTQIFFNHKFKKLMIRYRCKWKRVFISVHPCASVVEN
ncbi:MAG: hypothetical protein NUV58_04385, partial [Candidatus Roizmanbacteria bacterium]|nr:hypothetical protein [Candidatus Roizmanbacteria bacterium]